VGDYLILMEASTMSTNSIRLIEIPVEGNGGLVWNRLHSEREDICEAMVKEEFLPGSETQPGPQGTLNEPATDANWHRELLQARLRKIDDALDRLMSGSYGNCRECGKWIEDTKLEFDPAIAFCLGCWEREQRKTGRAYSTGDKREIDRQAIPTCDSQDHLIKISSTPSSLALKTLAPFDTVWVGTRNSDYRILLLDPESGRALVEGGHFFVEPVEAMVGGSISRGFTIKKGEIGIGYRLEMWVDNKIVSTSPVQSIRVEHHIAAEQPEYLCQR
jgi:RNA polymerase-binding transcription factor DksA